MAERLVLKIPEITRETIERLKKTFDVKTDEEVFSRALGLANTAVEVAGIGHKVTLTGQDINASVTISLDK